MFSLLIPFSVNQAAISTRSCFPVEGGSDGVGKVDSDSRSLLKELEEGAG
jgi:hypothetical protein